MKRKIFSKFVLSSMIIAGGLFPVKASASIFSLFEDRHIKETISEFYCFSEDVQPCKDGGFIITGARIQKHRGSDEPNGIYVLKYDKSLKRQWDVLIDDVLTGEAVMETDDNCYIVANGRRIVKLDKNGKVLWNTRLENRVREIKDLILSKKDNCIVACGSALNGDKKDDVYLCKCDMNGNIIDEKKYGTEYDDFGHAIEKDENGDFICVGSSNDTMYFMKVGADLDLKLSKTIGNSSGNANDIKFNGINEFIIAGQMDAHGALVKTDSNGNVHLQKMYNNHNFNAVQLHYGYYVLAGDVFEDDSVYNKDQEICMIDKKGKMQWSYILDKENLDAYTSGIVKVSPNEFVMVGYNTTLRTEIEVPKCHIIISKFKLDV